MLPGALADSLKVVLGSSTRIRNISAVGGGDTCASCVLLLSDGQRLFAKTARANQPPGDMFASEALALEKLHGAEAFRVPLPIVVDDDYLVMEYIELGTSGENWHERFGHALALLHQRCTQESFGFDVDNYCGLSRQYNRPHANWCEFWRTQRIEPQRARLAESGDYAALCAALDRLDRRLEQILTPKPQQPALLHGDLWSGNAGADTAGAPVIFDPASYYGAGEAEFGMMRLFGGFGPRVEAAYAEIVPLAPEADRRIAVYRLYHELNHLLLFGSAYYNACMNTLADIL